MLISHITPPEKLAECMDMLHDECGVADIESVRGGTQINLKGCAFKVFHKFLREIPGNEKITGIWSTRIGNGGHHIFHTHPEGTKSGVYYLRVGKGGQLVLGDNVIVPEVGMLVEFDSSVLHGTFPHYGQTRLAIAFDKK